LLLLDEPHAASAITPARINNGVKIRRFTCGPFLSLQGLAEGLARHEPTCQNAGQPTRELSRLRTLVNRLVDFYKGPLKS
jgi:hypothetical protein